MKKLSALICTCMLLACTAHGALTKTRLQTIDTTTVASARVNSDWVLVDTRLNDAFNGWKLDGVTRGGHITGAVDFSANWLRAEADDLEELLQEALAVKGITPDKNIVLYDANGTDAQHVADYLKKHGYNNLSYYNITEWAADSNRPMTRFPNYQKIIPASVLNEIINGNKPESFEKSERILLVEASWGEEKTSYAKGHIPGSFHINTDRIEPPANSKPMMWLLADDATLKTVARDFGFKATDTVILSGAEPMAAYRVATVLRYIGVQDVRVLNGGTTAWTMAGYALETKRHDPPAATAFGAAIPSNPDVFDTMDEVKLGLTKPKSFTLVDNRTWKEFIGEKSGYSYHDKKGRIPGAVFGYAGKTDSYAMDYYRNPDKTMRNPNEFLALWKEQGIDTTTHLSFMCGSGWRVAEIYYYADVVGLPDISVFSDGWIGWSNSPNAPTVTGTPQ